jgi:hypothetical protein
MARKNSRIWSDLRREIGYFLGDWFELAADATRPSIGNVAMVNYQRLLKALWQRMTRAIDAKGGLLN